MKVIPKEQATNITNIQTTNNNGGGLNAGGGSRTRNRYWTSTLEKSFNKTESFGY